MVFYNSIYNWAGFHTLLLVVQKSGEPVELGSLSYYLQGFSIISGGFSRRISEPSAVLNNAPKSLVFQYVAIFIVRKSKGNHIRSNVLNPRISYPTWMSRWKLGSMVSISGL